MRRRIPKIVELASFDPAFYRVSNADLATLSDRKLWAHYLFHGRRERRPPKAEAGSRQQFLAEVPQDGLLLEIGPFGSPSFSGPNVRYADARTQEQLQAIAPAHGMDPAKCPFIHYVVTETPLSEIPDRFSTVFSSHCIEHQPDLIGHLRDIERLLEPGGAFYLIVPDKRYCFDHFKPESTIADAIIAHAERRSRHTLLTLLRDHALVTHNEAARHRSGDHGEPAALTDPAGLEQMQESLRAAAAGSDYVDAHAWQFTPESFEAICSLAHAGGYTKLKPTSVWPTLRNRHEFCAVLERDHAVR